MGKTYCTGDVHNNFKAFKQCLERSNFDYENDRLIQLGDLVDGNWAELYEVIEELLKIKNKVLIVGNHDFFVKRWLKTGVNPDNWRQGGGGTLKSYCTHLDRDYTPTFSGYTTSLLPPDIPKSHIKLFDSQVPYFIDENNNCYVHGGFNRHFYIDDVYNSPDVLMWDRELWSAALSYEANSDETKAKHKFKIKSEFNKIFIGHTTTLVWHKDTFMQAANIINCDTGAGEAQGRLCMINVDTMEAVYSDYSKDLYPGIKGR